MTSDTPTSVFKVGTPKAIIYSSTRLKSDRCGPNPRNISVMKRRKNPFVNLSCPETVHVLSKFPVRLRVQSDSKFVQTNSSPKLLARQSAFVSHIPKHTLSDAVRNRGLS